MIVSRKCGTAAGLLSALIIIIASVGAAGIVFIVFILFYCLQYSMLHVNLLLSLYCITV